MKAFPDKRRLIVSLAAMLVLAPPATWANVPPPPPNYANRAAWSVQGEDDHFASTAAKGAIQSKGLPADIFYIHPTTDKSIDRLNQPLSDKAVNIWTDKSVVARQASIFTGCCRLFAPRYRQASSAALRAQPNQREAAFGIAFEDVRSAFRYYLANLSNERPFVLVGHSQGAAHLERLLDEELGSEPLRRRLIAAYIIGITLPIGKYGAASPIPACERPSSIGCVIHWASYLPTSNAAQIAAGIGAYNQTRLPPNINPTPLCINPLTFDQARPSASHRAARGAVIGAPDEKPIGPLLPRAVSARCEQGLLIVHPNPALMLAPIPDGNMHYHDFGLFYDDIRRNAILRTKCWFKRNSSKNPSLRIRNC